MVYTETMPGSEEVRVKVESVDLPFMGLTPNQMVTEGRVPQNITLRKNIEYLRMKNKAEDAFGKRNFELTKEVIQHFLEFKTFEGWPYLMTLWASMESMYENRGNVKSVLLYKTLDVGMY